MSGVLISGLLARIPWVEHGFGTRHAALSQDGMASVEQIHSSVVLVADRAGRVGAGDALITNRPGIAVSIRTADCLPILLADVQGHAVAIVHAGWRGTAAQICALTLQKMHAEFGTRADSVYAGIGPGIGVCCYEVGEEVARQFGFDRARHLDLAGINRRQLIAAGVPETHIDVLDACTCCDGKRFHSYRRDGDQAGRMISYIRFQPQSLDPPAQPRR